AAEGAGRAGPGRSGGRRVRRDGVRAGRGRLRRRARAAGPAAAAGGRVLRRGDGQRRGPCRARQPPGAAAAALLPPGQRGRDRTPVGLIRTAQAGSVRRGRRMLTVVPRPGALSTSSAPPAACARSDATESPSPVPWLAGLVV